uniref:Hexosyltransferase n=1 Tax=Saccoglossus kowalevskii TaxID=10224 RepID=A0ABM0MTH8_SACKO|nr:PREDICTED: uncharacterized protein LOC100378038 [Saccoglossus kowalevskii]
MYHIHRYYISEQVNRSVQEISELSDSLNAMHVLVNNLKDDTGTDHDWVSFSSHYIYRPPNTDKHSGQVTIHIQKIVKKALHYLQNEQGINLTLSHFIGGYYSVHFKHIEYLIDFKFTNHQPDALSSSLVKCVHLIETLKYPQNERIISDVNRNLHVNFVIVGEHNSLTQFLESFETMELKWQTSIVNILFVDASPQATSLEATSSEKNLNLIIAKFKNKHTNLNFQSLEQNVNQLNGYLAGFQYLNVANRDTLFLFGHTNIHHIVWSHCLTNTIKGKQIYLPVPWYDKQEVHLVDEQHMQSMFTFCAYGSDVSKANIFTDKYSQQLNAHQVIEQFTKQQIFVFQAYEPVFFSTPIR